MNRVKEKIYGRIIKKNISVFSPAIPLTCVAGLNILYAR